MPNIKLHTLCKVVFYHSQERKMTKNIIFIKCLTNLDILNAALGKSRPLLRFNVSNLRCWRFYSVIVLFQYSTLCTVQWNKFYWAQYSTVCSVLYSAQYSALNLELYSPPHSGQYCTQYTEYRAQYSTECTVQYTYQ